ncbi:hypothetical protein GX50_04568 [[Emmonsia] crescens]|uniref:Uncharacterized protein n=1 Tax=[Emmonsia] crescens TaxID=73230 RepID=A0A2B7Z8B4_9EURO|nr:hypothetical protein GX50_04568 [Emmonsia crescens]
MAQRHLLSLPFEIRARIYELVMKHERTLPINPYGVPRKVQTTSWPLLCTSSQAHAETLSVIKHLKASGKLRYAAVLFLTDEKFVELYWTSIPALFKFVSRIDLTIKIRGERPTATSETLFPPRPLGSRYSEFSRGGTKVPNIIYTFWHKLASLPGAGVLNFTVVTPTTKELQVNYRKNILPYETDNQLWRHSTRAGIIHPLTVATQVARYTAWLFEPRNYHPTRPDRPDIAKMIGHRLMRLFDAVRISTDEELVEEWPDLVKVRDLIDRIERSECE